MTISRSTPARALAIVPAFNESKSIAGVIAELAECQPSFEVAVVDDGSQDATIEVAAAHGATVLPLPFNLGIGGAVQAGFLYARDTKCDIAVQVDGDGQHDRTKPAGGLWTGAGCPSLKPGEQVPVRRLDRVPDLLDV